MTIKESFDKAIHPGEQKTAGVETQYAVIVTPDAVWLEIEGSVQKEDWKSNFDFAVVPYKKQLEKWLAHKGFVTRWKQAREQIVKEVKDAISATNLPLRITGYSHGAAIALLAHEDFGFMGYDPETIVFGCPRVLWMPSRKIKARFSKLTRVMNRSDIVTHVPFALMMYRHVGNIVKVGKSNFNWIKSHYISRYEKYVFTE